MEKLKRKKNLKNIVLFFIFLILVVFWMGVIFKFSSANGEKSTGTSRSSLEKIITLFNKNIDKDKLDEIVIKYDVVLRKFTHFSGYLVGGVLIYFMYFYLNKLVNYKLKYIKLYSVVTGSIYAMTDELHQHFVPGRSGEIKDVLLDTSGVITGIIIVWLVISVIQKCKLKRVS